MGSIGCPILRGWLLVCCLGPGYLCAGAISKAEIAISILFPAATVNEFGFSGPQSDLPVPITDWDGDGHVVHPTTQWPEPVETATVTKLQLDPLRLFARTGQIELETTNEGDASADATGFFSGRLANLTAAPLTVTFTFDVQTFVFTKVDCDECDYATAEVGALFGFGDWNDFVIDSSTNGSPSFPFGFTGGAVDITIPAKSVVPYWVDFWARGEASSFCADSTCQDTPPGPPSVPEPGTLFLAGGGLAGLFQATRIRSRNRR